MWALIKDGKIVVERSTWWGCLAEAYSQGLVVRIGSDGPRDMRGKVMLASGVEITRGKQCSR